jgi:hypothetical protein
MNVRFLAIVLVGTTLFLASSARATSVRTNSGYSPEGPLLTPTDFPGGEYWLWNTTFCFPSGSPQACSNTGFGNFGTDLFVQITPNSLSLPLDVTLDLGASFNATGTPDSPFGQIDCAAGFGGELGGQNTPFVGPCASSNTNGTAPSGCVLPNPTPGTDITVVLPSSCLQVGEVFYFDLADTKNISITPGSATVPEPSSLALFGLALVPLMLFSKRRVQA